MQASDRSGFGTQPGAIAAVNERVVGLCHAMGFRSYVLEETDRARTEFWGNKARIVTVKFFAEGDESEESIPCGKVDERTIKKMPQARGEERLGAGGGVTVEDLTKKTDGELLSLLTELRKRHRHPTTQMDTIQGQETRNRIEAEIRAVTEEMRRRDG